MSVSLTTGGSLLLVSSFSHMVLFEKPTGAVEKTTQRAKCKSQVEQAKWKAPNRKTSNGKLNEMFNGKTFWEREKPNGNMELDGKAKRKCNRKAKWE